MRELRNSLYFLIGFIFIALLLILPEISKADDECIVLYIAATTTSYSSWGNDGATFTLNTSTGNISNTSTEYLTSVRLWKVQPFKCTESTCLTFGSTRDIYQSSSLDASAINTLIDSGTYAYSTSAPTECINKCGSLKDTYYDYIKLPGLLSITKDCISGCEVSIDSGKADQSITPYIKDDDGNYWTLGSAFYTGEACTAGQQSVTPDENEIPTCTEFLEKCESACMGHTIFKACIQDGERLCTCEGQAPPMIDMGADGWKPDSDLDGEENKWDSDVDGDGKANGQDSDVDGDGIDNKDDSDVDGDGTKNDGTTGWTQGQSGTGNGLGSDYNVDGDEELNGSDNDVDGDGTKNGSDSDVDGDGVPNNIDGDVDGDGYDNWCDADIDGDGILNADDADPYGNSTVAADTNGDGKVDSTDSNTGDNGTTSSTKSGSTATGDTTDDGTTETGTISGEYVPEGEYDIGVRTDEQMGTIKGKIENAADGISSSFIENIDILYDNLTTTPEVPRFEVELSDSSFIFGRHVVVIDLENWEPALDVIKFFLGCYFIVLCINYNKRFWIK